MTILDRFLVVPVLALVAAAVLIPAGVQAGRPYDAEINNEQALTFQGKVVSVDPAGLSMSVRGAEGFRTFKTRPSMVKGLATGDGVNISFLKDQSGPKAMSIAVTEKAQRGSQAQRIREEKERAKDEAQARKSAKNAQNLPTNQTVNDDLGYGRGYYVPPDQR
jgi:hypothetical protein